MPSYTVDIDAKSGDVRTIPTASPADPSGKSRPLKKKKDDSWKRVTAFFFLLAALIIAWKVWNDPERNKPKIIHADR
jgi:hypothetical protein